ncbi:hypothetical protein H6F95_23710 [Cyanobacteria bacterium FACHB-471]|nr:hypothetical protein [Cyanobacteria bacterium FACHB-471]
MATERTKSGRSESTQIRKQQLLEIQNVIAVIEPRLQRVVEYQKSQLNLLESVSLGLYDEIDKLSKKAPVEPVTDLVLEQMNEVIRETKELVANDPYVQRLQEFVPAGDNPQQRDAVVVMRQVRQGLARFRQQLDPLTKQLGGYLTDAKVIEKALRIYLEGHELVSYEKLRSCNLDVSNEWLTHGYPQNFDFRKLDEIDITAYFEISNE